MWADVLTKPLQGAKFRLMRAFLMNCPINYSKDPIITPTSNPTLSSTTSTLSLWKHSPSFVPTDEPTDIPMKKQSLRPTPSSWRCVETKSHGTRVASRIGIFRSVLVGISPYRYQRETRSVFSVSKIWPLKKLAGAPFFLRRGGFGPHLGTSPPFEEKKEFPRNFSKKEFSRNLQKVFPPKLTVQKYRPKIPIPAVSDTG